MLACVVDGGGSDIGKCIRIDLDFSACFGMGVLEYSTSLVSGDEIEVRNV